MATPMTLHVRVGAPCCLSAMLCARANNLDVKFQFHTSGNQQCPALVVEEGTITNPEAILRYMCGVKAYLGVAGQSAFDRAQVDMWLGLISCDLQGAGVIRRIQQGAGEWTPEVHDSAKSGLKAALERFEEHLALRTFFVGSSVTLADLSFVATLAANRSLVLDAEAMKAFPNVLRHFTYMTSTSFFTSVMGRAWGPMTQHLALADPAKCKGHGPVLLADAPPAKGGKGAKGDKGKGQGQGAGKDKAQKPKQAPAPKKEAPKAPPKEEKPEKTPEELAEEEAARAAGGWFFNYKTLFTNATDRSAAIDTLVKECPFERFSFWWCRYDKLPKECKDRIRTNNQMSFFFRGLEGTNKDSLAVHGAYGPDNDHDIRGVWMMKGKTHLPGMKENNTYEYLEWRELDIKNKPEDLALLKSYWLNTTDGEGSVEGLTPLAVRLWK